MTTCKCWAMALAGILSLPPVVVGANSANEAIDKGIACLEKQDYDGSIAAFSEAIRLNPKLAASYRNRGVAYKAKGEWDKAIADFTEAIRLNPKFTDAYDMRGMVYAKKGEQAKAEADFAQAKTLRSKGRRGPEMPGFSFGLLLPGLFIGLLLYLLLRNLRLWRPSAETRRYNIRWHGFWDEVVWLPAFAFGLFSALLVIAAVSAALPRSAPMWLQCCAGGLPMLAFGCLVFWVARRYSLRRARQLASVAEKMGMTFTATLTDSELLPLHDLPLMVHRRDQPRNVLSGAFSGVNVRLFDLATGRFRNGRKHTVVYFPDPLPCLSDFPTGWLGRRIPGAYTAVLERFGDLTVEARAGRLIVYRWSHLLRPESYLEFLAVASKVYCELASLGAVSDE